jgi:hypothetical protein
MFCISCGASLHAGQAYCSACGKPVQDGVRAGPTPATPPAPSAVHAPPYQLPGRPYAQAGATGRIARHLRTLAILWLVVSGLHLISGMRLFTLGHIGIPFFPVNFGPFLSPLFSTLGVLAMISAVAGLLVGWALLQHEPWARMLAIIMGIIILPRIPFGTALGIYTLWILVPVESEAEYRDLARPV